MTQTSRKRSAWERVMLAAENGTGCRLDAAACLRLSRDGAVQERARLDEEARLRGCDHWWHEAAEPYETRCPACGKDE